MYEIKEHRREIQGGLYFTTFSREIISGNVLEVEAGTTGYMGGDSGHGGRTYIRIENKAGDMTTRIVKNEEDNDGVEIMLGGDCELSTIITGLKFIIKALEDQIEGKE